MTEDDIVNSEAFKTINFLIDQKAGRMKNNINSIYFRIDNLRNDIDKIETRISYEQDHNVEVNTDLIELYEIANQINNIRKYENEIDELMKYKNQLIGDWDTVRDDFTIMKSVFNDTIE